MPDVDSWDEERVLKKIRERGVSRKSQTDGWEELYNATADLMDSFTATGPKFDRVRDALKAIHN